MKTFVTRLGAFVACVGVAASLAACGSSSSSNSSSATGASGSAATSASAAASGSSTSKVPIAYLGGTGTPAFAAVEQGVRTGAKASNADVTYIAYPITPQGLLSACQDAISSGKYKSIVIMSLIASAGVPCAKAAAEHHMPLITTFGPIGSSLTDPKPTVPGVTSQVFLTDTTQANALVSMVPSACASQNPCQVVWERTTQTIPDLDALIGKAVNALTASHPNIKLVGQADPEETESTAITATQQLMQAHPQAKVIIGGASQSGSGALVALKSNPNKVAILSTGCGQVQVRLIRAKQLYGCNVWLAQTEAAEAVKLASQAGSGQKIPSYVSPLQIAGNLPAGIDQENIGKYPQFVGQFQR